MAAPSLSELLERLRAGDPQAGDTLNRRFRGDLLRFCGSYLEASGEAEDAVQEVLAKAWKAELVPDNLRAWLYTVARNHCLNVLRSRGRGLPLTPLRCDIELAASCTGPATRLVHREDLQRLERWVAALSPAERELIRLRYGEELTRDEMALVLELPASTVKSQLFEAVKKLRSRVGRQES